VLTVTQMLRKKGVVGKFVEFFGPGLDHLSLADRATIANMAPEYGATCGFFPVDAETIDYLTVTGRDRPRRAGRSLCQGAGHVARRTPDPVFTDTLSSTSATSCRRMAGPKRPQDRVPLTRPPLSQRALDQRIQEVAGNEPARQGRRREVDLGHGDVVIAAITSCTNTSNPSVLIAAGLLARKAARKGLKPKPWVKTSLAPGSQVVTDYLRRRPAEGSRQARLQPRRLSAAPPASAIPARCRTPISKRSTTTAWSPRRALRQPQLRRPRLPDVQANYLASPPLVVAYALAGSMKIDLTKEPLGTTRTASRST
jgi:aconitate hydratase